MLQYLISGLEVGSTYGLIAVAITMVYSISGVVAFWLGEVFMAAAFAALVLNTHLHVPFGLAAVGGLGVATLLGMVIAQVSYRPLANSSVLTLLIAALSVSEGLQAVGQLLFGAQQTPFPNPIGRGVAHVGGAVLDPIGMLTVLVALAAMAVLAVVMGRTPIGRAMRAVAQDREAARLMGLSVPYMIFATFAIGSILSGIAGILYAAKYQIVFPTIGSLPALKGIIAAVLGGVGSIPGAFLGGLVLGLAEEVGAGVIPSGSEYSDVIAFVALGLILWLRPTGLLGLRVSERT